MAAAAAILASIAATAHCISALLLSREKKYRACAKNGWRCGRASAERRALSQGFLPSLCRRLEDVYVHVGAKDSFFQERCPINSDTSSLSFPNVPWDTKPLGAIHKRRWNTLGGRGVSNSHVARY